MSILVDYRCTDCGGQQEAFVDSPPPSRRTCAACGGESRRRWSPVGMISRRGEASRAPESSVRAAPPGASLCAQNPDVPGLCHMSPSAGRAWVARARGDNRALDAELASQQKAAALSKPTVADAISHEHSHPHI
ncbi:hypothetical protein ACEXQE_17720 [Herbiconiux sp. P17]|uniref:hypothetical protein n=1 Tax=Herbiconiux wuyangfengii TaxID=3342794 RepID=UPI0035B8D00F